MMNWHILGNYTDEKTRTTVDGAGAVSQDGSINPLAGFTEPKLRATITSTYTEGAWSVTGQARLIGSAVLSNQLVAGVNSVDNNSVPAVVYGDFRGSYRGNAASSSMGRSTISQCAAAQSAISGRWRHELRHLRLHRPRLPHWREVD
jgi:hypothetical protein